VDPKRRSRLIFRVVIGLQLAVLTYMAAFFLLNAPAYLQQVRFKARGQDLSADIAGQYIPLETLQEVTQQIDAVPFPVIEIDLSGLMIASQTQQVAQQNPQASTVSASKPPSPRFTPLNPNVFVPNTVTVPRLGIRAPLVEIANNTEKVQQRGLESGVIHIAESPAPGQEGTAFFAGHSSDFFLKKGKYKTIFALLPELNEGDYFILSDAMRAYYYKVFRTVVTGPNDVSVMEQAKDGDYFAGLQTSYPVGTAAKRFVVLGRLDRTVDASKLAKP
jgi:LPXTG-site transpeptidase (sortase) family protein